jgi:UDP-N-acetylmuramoyl-tripeptide--D-alanyl-D-alanine ligase
MMVAKADAASRLIDTARRAHARATTAVKRVKNGLKDLHARAERSRSRATYIGVTGSSGKTTTVNLLAHILSADFNVRTQADRNGFENASKALRQVTREDQFVVLEIGTSGPGLIERTTRLVRPDIAIVTMVAVEHYTAFRGIEAVAQEKAQLVRGLSSSGLAILNADDPNVRGMSGLTNARSALFGTSGGDFQVTNLRTSGLGTLALTVMHGNETLDLESQLIGAHNWLAICAAVACALHIGVAPQTIAARVATFEPVPGRLSVQKIAGGPTFLLDCAKAPLHSVGLAFETLRTLHAARKRCIVGQISDFRGNSDAAYQKVYRAAKEVADELIFVGPNAHKVRASREDVQQGRFRTFETVQELSSHLQATAVPDEVILLKSARNLHLERLMLDCGGEVRCWPNQCGSKLSCMDCGRHRTPFASAAGIS